MARYRISLTHALAAIVLSVSWAASVPAADVAVFDDELFVDTTSGGNSAESDNVQASLVLLGHSVSTITSTSSVEFSAALATAEVLLVPELENGDLGAALDPVAISAIAAFVAGGGGLIVNGTTDQNAANFVNRLFGTNLMTGVVGASVKTAEAAGTAFDATADAIPDNTRTRGIDTVTLPERSLSLYFNGLRSAVARIAHVGGRIVYLGWDWFDAVPTGGSDSGWLEVLDAAIADVLACTDPTGLDTDGDGIADECDEVAICADVDGQRTITRPTELAVRHVNADAIPGNDGLSFVGEFVLPEGSSFSDIQPLDSPVTVVVTASDGTPRIAETIPTVVRDGEGTAGWRRRRRGDKWSFIDNEGALNNGIITLIIKDRNEKQSRRVRITIAGKRGNYPVVAGDEPLNATVIVADPAAGECASTRFTPEDCRFRRKRTIIKCGGDR